MSASRSGLAKTSGSARPDAARTAGLVIHFETTPARQSVALRSRLGTLGQNCGNSAVGEGSMGGNLAPRQRVEPQLRLNTIISADRAVGGSQIP